MGALKLVSIFDLQNQLRFKDGDHREEMESKKGAASWSSGRSYSNIYASDFVEQVRYLIDYKDTIVDIGSGYGFVAHYVASELQCKFIGYEINEERVKKAKSFARKQRLVKMSNTKFICQDVSDDDFTIPDAKVYYMYDPVNVETLKHILKKLSEVKSDQVRFLYFKYGRGETFKVIKESSYIKRINGCLYLIK